MAYFRDLEDQNVREDEHEGVSVYHPTEGLQINNQTQKTQFTMKDFSFEARVKQKEIFVYCVSRLLSDELRGRFKAVACVEILKTPTLCERMKIALPHTAIFRAGRVEYYHRSEGPTPRYALPDLIARSKFDSYRWQSEFRFLFSLTDALEFEKAEYRFVKGEAREGPKPEEHIKYLVATRSLRDICRQHIF
ncbi:MAG TPA: hypothetical protein VN875_12065 [Candidatus Binatus sp.]|jgi:hypothetical protein|nr:hypothetical protein [Candidatus Binatus sp.]